MGQSSHIDLIVDQFTRQATPFSTASPITDAAALKLIVETSGAKATDTCADVARGGAWSRRAFARSRWSTSRIEVRRRQAAVPEYRMESQLTSTPPGSRAMSPRCRTRLARFRLCSRASRSIIFLIRLRC